MLFALPVCALADPEPNYHALHEGVPTEALRMENVELRRDKASLTLKNGQLSFVKAALDRPVIAVFTGEGIFRLKPANPIESAYMAKVLGKPDAHRSSRRPGSENTSREGSPRRRDASGDLRSQACSIV